ncbi:hypothetical protein VPHK369_0090 [Vibrio phage K369]
MIAENFEDLLKDYVEGTQDISDFHIDEVRYYMCGIEGQMVTVKGQNINTFEAFEFRVIVTNILMWYTNQCFENMRVSIHG